MTDFYPDGECPIPTFYEKKEEPIVIYDHEGNPMMVEKVKLGFDLTGE